jgi:putative glutamine amidotransferase
MAMLMRPLIGIVLDWQEHGSFSPRPHYAIRDNYFNAIWQVGGLPIGLPLLEPVMAETLNHVHGVLVPGGDYTSPSYWYDDGLDLGTAHPRAHLNEKLISDVIGRDMPLLGICAGHHELIAALGGKLHRKIKEAMPQAHEHRAGTPAVLSHEVVVTDGSLLRRLVGREVIEVNSHHNEAGKILAGGLMISGLAPDGVMEAIELPHKRFVLGVQWHPEFLLTDADRAILKGFVDACAE